MLSQVFIKKGKKAVKLSHLIHEKALICNLKATTKLDAIEEIAKLFSDDHHQVAEIIAAAHARESLGPTLLPKTQVAIPHGRDSRMQDFYVGVGISQQGINDESPLGGTEKVHLVFLIVAHPMKNELVLRVMAALATHLKNHPNWVGELLKAQSKEELRTMFSQVQTPPKLSLLQIIEKPLLTLTPEHNLQEAVALMVQHNVFYVPVVNEQGEFLGEVTDRDILLFSVPDYILRLDSLLFVVEDEPFGRFLMQETEFKVKDVLNKSPFTIDSKAPIIEATHKMLKNTKRYLYVLENNRLVGIVTQKDVIRKILFV